MTASFNIGENMASIKRNYVYNLVAQLLAILFPIITTPYLTRILGNRNLGIFDYAQSIVNYFILFGCFGLNTYAQREVAYHKSNRHQQSIVFAEVMVVRFITITVSLIVYWISIIRTADYPLYYSLFGLELLAALVDVSWFLQGNENFKCQMIRTMITRFLGFACIFLFVKEESDLHLYIFYYSFMILVGNLTLWFPIRKSLERIRINEMRPMRHLKPALVMFLPQIAVSVYTQLDKTMIGLLTDHDYNEVGFYGQAERIVKMAMTIVTSLGSVMLSRVTIAISHDDQKEAKAYIEKSFQYMYLLGCPIAFGLAAICPKMVPWFFGSGFEPVIPCMILLCPLVLIIGVSNIFGIQYMIPTRRMKEYTASIFCGMAVNVVFNGLLIPVYGAIGAVISTLLAESVVSIRQYFSLRNIFSHSVFLIGARNMIAAAIMGCIVYMLSYLLPIGVWATALEIAIGVLLYFVILIILHDDFLGSVIKQCRR